MPQETPRNRKEESRESRDRDIVVESHEEAVGTILEMFSIRQTIRHRNKEYHGPHHPKGVEGNGTKFLEIVGSVDSSLVDEKDQELFRMAAAAHDVVLHSFDEEDQRVRFRGFYPEDMPEQLRRQYPRELIEKYGGAKGNELLSAEELWHEMRRCVYVNGTPVFSDEDRQKVFDAIAATFPQYGIEEIPETQRNFFPKGLERYRNGLKIWQPHLKEDSSLVALALGNADLHGEIATGDPEDYRQSGNAELRELKLYIKRAVERSIENISPEERAKIAGEVLGWLRTQVSFAMWQKHLFWESIHSSQKLNASPRAEEIKKKLSEFYDAKFDKSILAAKKRYEKFEKKFGKFEDAEERKRRIEAMTAKHLRELLEEMGYEISE